MHVLDYVALPAFLVGLLLLSANVLASALNAKDALERQRARLILTGPALALVVGLALVVSALAWKDVGIPTGAYVMLAWSLPLSFAYGMLKHNLFEIDAMVRRSLTAGLLFLTVALGYLGAFVALQRVAVIAPIGRPRQFSTPGPLHREAFRATIFRSTFYSCCPQVGTGDVVLDCTGDVSGVLLRLWQPDRIHETMEHAMGGVGSVATHCSGPTRGSATQLLETMDKLCS